MPFLTTQQVKDMEDEVERALMLAHSYKMAAEGWKKSHDDLFEVLKDRKRKIWEQGEKIRQLEAKNATDSRAILRELMDKK